MTAATVMTPAHKARVQDALKQVQRAIDADTTGTGQAHVNLMEATHRLQIAVATPAENLMRMRFQPMQQASIRMALETGALNVLAAHPGKSMTSADLAAHTGFDALFIARILRLVAYVGVADEVAPMTYRANATTDFIASPGGSAAEKHHYDLFFPIGTRLMEYMNDTNNFKQSAGHVNGSAASKPTNVAKKHPGDDQILFAYAYNGLSMWEYMQRVNPAQQRYFDEYMAIRRLGLATWHETFPMARELAPGLSSDDNAVLLVDVGGNMGHELQGFHAAHPDLRGRLILQDVPSVIDKVEQLRKEHAHTRNGNSTTPPHTTQANGEANSVMAGERVECMAYDFFTPQPVKGARAYYLRNIFHDWSDSESERILRRVAEAMTPEYSRVLIDDYVLPDTGASMRGAAMDVLMMMFCGGMERTRQQWLVLLDKAGLELVKVWNTRSDYEQIIEAKLKT